jgi:hypothetical protein
MNVGSGDMNWGGTSDYSLIWEHQRCQNIFASAKPRSKKEPPIKEKMGADDKVVDVLKLIDIATRTRFTNYYELSASLRPNFFLSRCNAQAIC